MAAQFLTPPNPTPLGRTLDWMQAQVPDRYWETADAERVLQLVEATSPSTQLEIDPPAILWLDNAVARLAELDRENDARLREKGMLVEESDLFRPI